MKTSWFNIDPFVIDQHLPGGPRFGMMLHLWNKKVKADEGLAYVVKRHG